MLEMRHQIDDVVWSNLRRFKGSEYLFGVDNNQDPKSLFDNAELRVLVCFLSTGKVRSVSNTFTALFTMLKDRLGDKVFVDYSYFPESEDLELYKELGLPVWFGNVSHAPIRDYDFVLMSHAILPEVLNMPYGLVNSDIPLKLSERSLDRALPPILYGGASSHVGQIIYGKDGDGLAELVFAGYAEGILDDLIEEVHDYVFEARTRGIPYKKELVDHLLRNSKHKEYLYYPPGYRYHYAEDNITITKIEKVLPHLPDRVKVGQKWVTDFPGFRRKVFNLDGESADSHDIMISQGCSAHLCTFCSEGQLAGGWRQKSIENLTKDMDDSLLYSAANTGSFYSFNLNFYSPFLDLLAETSKRFSHLALINQRTDVIATAPEYLELSKALGLIRVSMAVEGMGDRIRMKIHNKNLSRDILMRAARNVFSHKLIMLKMGMILTGQENDDDIDAFISEIDEILKIREEMGANTKIQLSFTPLVIYGNTPLRWLPRITARQSLDSERTMHRFIAAMQERGIRTKFNGRGPGTYIEQMLLDLGPAGLNFLKTLSLEKGMLFYRHFGEKDRQNVLDALKEHEIDPYSFLRERDIDEPQPVDTFIFTTESNYEDWKEQHKKRDFEHEYCLRTPAHPVSQCYTCGYCETPAQVKSIVKRPLENINTVQSVLISLSESRHATTTRITAKLDSRWDFYSKDSLSFFIASRILRANPDLVPGYYGLGKNTCSWVSSNGQKGWFGGTFVFDMFWKDRIQAKDIEPLLEKINDQLTVAKVVKISNAEREQKIDTRGEVSYLGVLDGWSMSYIQDRMASFDWQIRVAIKAMGGLLECELRSMPGLKQKILFVPHKHQILVYMTLPINVNPHLVMASLFGKSYEKILQEIRFQVMGHYFEIDSSCACGQHLVMNLSDNKTSPKCPTCLGKITLYKITQRVA